MWFLHQELNPGLSQAFTGWSLTNIQDGCDLMQDYHLHDVQVTHHAGNASRVPKVSKGPCIHDVWPYESSASHTSFLNPYCCDAGVSSSCTKPMCSGSCISPLRDTSEWSTHAYLLGTGNAVLASSSWQSASEGPELPFYAAEDSHFTFYSYNSFCWAC